MFFIEFTATARKQLVKLPRDVQIGIIAVLERIRIRPYSYVKRLAGNKLYRLRVGDYRVILDINRNKLIIIVITIGNRSNIYKQS